MGVSWCAKALRAIFLVSADYTERVRAGDRVAAMVILRVDHASFFNSLPAPIVDSVPAERGLPDEFRSLAREVGSDASVAVSTP